MLLAEYDFMARTLWGEARGEPYAGKLAVAWVIRNRARNKHRKETTLAGVCTEPSQFSCWNFDDPNRAKMEAIDYSDPHFCECLRAALEVMHAPMEADPTHGAEYYHANWVDPYWARGKTATATIGGHKFYLRKDIDG